MWGYSPRAERVLFTFLGPKGLTYVFERAILGEFKNFCLTKFLREIFFPDSRFHGNHHIKCSFRKLLLIDHISENINDRNLKRISCESV